MNFFVFPFYIVADKSSLLALFWRNSDIITYFLFTPWRYRSCGNLTVSHILYEVSWKQTFYRVGSSAPRPTPNLEDQGLLVWHLLRNMSGMGGPTSSYAATGIALEFTGAHKSPHLATKYFRLTNSVAPEPEGSSRYSQELATGI
jgi:hypothetical protein